MTVVERTADTIATVPTPANREEFVPEWAASG
jgi:hypothetical protein